MKSSGITRGVAVIAIAALSVAGLPLFTGTAHAVVATVQIDNLRDRTTFDLDELRDGDDFRILTLNDAGRRVNEGEPTYRWTLNPGTAGEVEGDWVTADARGRGQYRVLGPSRTHGLDNVRDRQVQAGTWLLEALAPGTAPVSADPLEVEVSESEIVLDTPVTQPDGTQTVSGTLANATDPLAGRAVGLTYTRTGGGDARIQSAASVVTDADGGFEVTLVDPNGPTGQVGRLVAVATGEERDDLTQLPHWYGPDDADNPAADAADARKLTWEGPPATVAKLRGRSNGARADVLKVVAPSKSRGAQVRLFRVRPGGRLALLDTRALNNVGDKKFRVRDRNRKGFTTYVAKVGATATAARDTTNRRRVR